MQHDSLMAGFAPLAGARKRGKLFRKQDWVRISACLTYAMCYTACCEMSIDPEYKKYKGLYRQALKEMHTEYYLDV